MAENRGKEFEKRVRRGFEKVDNTCVVRLQDTMNGFAGSANICDFVVYNRPYMYLIECKSCHGNTLSFSNISDTQWKGLLEKSEIDGVIAGILVWFIDKDVTTFIPIQALEYHKKCGEKSVNCAKLDEDYGMNNCTISGKKEKVFFDYNMNSLFDYIEAMEAYEDNIPEPVDYE